MEPQNGPQSTINGRSSPVWIVLAAVVLVLGAVVLYPVFAPPSYENHRLNPLTSVKELALASIMYGADHDDHMPLANNWMDSLGPYTMNEALFVDWELPAPKPEQFGFALFRPAAGIDAHAVETSATVPLVFQSTDVRRNANGDLSIRAMRPKGEGSCVSFLDGHAKYMPKDWPHGPVVIVLAPFPKVQRK